MTQTQSSRKPARFAAARKRPGGSKGGSSVRTTVPQCIATSVFAFRSRPAATASSGVKWTGRMIEAGS
jgi:hypothetical protein